MNDLKKVLMQEKIAAKELNNVGIYSSKITKLVEKGVLIKLGYGIYQCKIDEYLKYEFELARKDENKTEKFIQQIKSIFSHEQEQKVMLFLYQKFLKLNEEDEEFANSIKEEDLAFATISPDFNKALQLLINNKVYEALNLLKTIERSPKQNIVLFLTTEINKINIEIYREINKQFEKENYLEMISLLNSLKKIKNLSFIDQKYIELLQFIINVQNGFKKEITRKKENYSNFTEALYHSDYRAAYSMATENNLITNLLAKAIKLANDNQLTNSIQNSSIDAISIEIKQLLDNGKTFQLKEYIDKLLEIHYKKRYKNLIDSGLEVATLEQNDKIIQEIVLFIIQNKPINLVNYIIKCNIYLLEEKRELAEAFLNFVQEIRKTNNQNINIQEINGLFVEQSEQREYISGIIENVRSSKQSAFIEPYSNEELIEWKKVLDAKNVQYEIFQNDSSFELVIYYKNIQKIDIKDLVLKGKKYLGDTNFSKAINTFHLLIDSTDEKNLSIINYYYLALAYELSGDYETAYLYYKLVENKNLKENNGYSISNKLEKIKKQVDVSRLKI